MKLFASATSPYARKCRVALIEKKLEDRVEIIWTSPFEEGSVADQLKSHAPLNKIPALVLPNGQSIYDSRVICEYLDGFDLRETLLPQSGQARILAQTQMALADGILDAAFAIVMELRRPIAQQSKDWIERWRDNIARALSVAIQDRSRAIDPSEFGLAEIGVACAIDYLDFRLESFQFVGIDARRWRDAQQRQSLEQTMPGGGA
ncbi:MAG: hypothetical protein RL268_800 [Pseudomonadota bacterium]|jgi:glutathione S-transferase